MQFFKKILLAVSALMTVSLWIPQAQAVPAFARQVGMACSACHFQHFPVLNAFGRSFKEAGFTMIGSQEKIEGEGLSLPAVMNSALVGYMGYQKTNGPVTANGTIAGPAVGTNATLKDTNNGTFEIPLQVSLFVAGRGGEHIGYETEINIAGAGTETAGATGVGLIRIKVPMVYDVGNVKAGIVPFSTQGLGVADSFEVLNTGAVAVHAFNQFDMAAISAQQYIGTSTPASGVAFIASNDNFFANVAKWGANQGGGTSGGPSSNYFRGAWTTGLIPGFDSAIGFQLWNGTSAVDPSATAGVLGGNAAFVTGVVDTKASAIDAQMMGDVHGMPLLLVASYAKAPISTGTNPNFFNNNGGNVNSIHDKKSFNIGAELGVVPGKATLQVGFRRASSGIDVGGVNASDNALLFGATYNLALNARLELTYSKYSGDLYNSTSVTAGNVPMGDNLVTLDLAFGF